MYTINQHYLFDPDWKIPPPLPHAHLTIYFYFYDFRNAIIFINPPFSCLLNFLHSRSKMRRDWMWLLIWSVIWDVEQSTALRGWGSQKYFYIWVLHIFKWMWTYWKIPRWQQWVFCVLSIIRQGIFFLYKGKKSQVLLHVSRHNLKILLKSWWELVGLIHLYFIWLWNKTVLFAFIED